MINAAAIDPSEVATNTEAWLRFAGLVVVQLVILFGLLRQQRATTQVKEQVDRTVELSTPTGNGFATRVEQKLDRLEQKLDRHLGDHASADVNRRKS